MNLVVIFLASIVVVLVVVIFFLAKRRSGKDNSFLMIQQQLDQLNRSLDDKLSESNKAIQSQFGQSTKIVKEVTERLGKIDQTNREIADFAQQLQSLEDVLKNPKQRGILGEYYLEELLKNVFSPSQYKLQYSFKDGETVDAVIFLRDDKILPIDSKFSLENYNKIIQEKDKDKRQRLERIFYQDLKNRIEETAKYIRPREGTLDFAFMFIPAEAIYYDLLVNKIGAIQSNTRDLIEYAVKEKKVIPVSPTSFYAYLQTILQGLRAFQIEKSAQEIRQRVEDLSKHLSNYEEYLRKTGSSLSSTVSAYNKSYKAFGRIDKDITKIIDKKSKVEPKEIEKPTEE